MKFKEGDRVKITSSSQYYNQGYIDKSNPKDIAGTITEIDYDICVTWDNTQTNVYNERDLELIEIKFNVGDKVRIKSSSRYYGEDCEHNPKNVTGKIIEVRDYEYPFRVKWPNGTNVYGKDELEYAPTEKETLINNKQKPTQHEQSNNTIGSGIKVCRPTPTISRNQRCTGNGIRGNRKRVTITVGCLGYKEVIS